MVNWITQGNAENVRCWPKNVEEEERAGARGQEPVASLSPKGPSSATEFGPRELSPHERGAGTLL